MNLESLTSNLNTKWLGRPTLYYETIGSTNVEAAALVERDERNNHGTALIASRQTAGRGTGGAKWVSERPDGLSLTLVLKYPLKKEPIQFIPAVAAVQTLRDQFDLDAHVKWPNDVLYENKKIGGILCERIGRYCIVGIGLNINREDFPEEIKHRAISLYQITGMKHSIEPIFQSFLANFENLYDLDGNLNELWKAHSRMIGRHVTIFKNHQPFQVEVVDLSPEGFLMVKHASGEVQALISTSELDVDLNY